MTVLDIDFTINKDAVSGYSTANTQMIIEFPVWDGYEYDLGTGILPGT
jgi:hypothetical protein